MFHRRAMIVFAALYLAVVCSPASQLRPATNEADSRYWLANMLTHGYSAAEIAAVLGMPADEVPLRLAQVQPLRSTNTLLVLPYPGGRHPRIGFLDGAIDPQRDTKVSIFTPWDNTSYVVVDVPEAIFSNLGLIYLAHTHVPTLWSAKSIELPPVEWKRKLDGSLESARMLPNNISFGATVRPLTNAVFMELWLKNGTDKPLTDIRVQNCVMLKQAAGFSAQTNANKRLRTPVAAAQSADGKRWVITAWEPCHRTWQNPPVPCIHSDPRIPDCPPGEARQVRGVLTFYEGEDPAREFDRVAALARRRLD